MIEPILLLLDPMSDQHGDFIDYDLVLFELSSVGWQPLFPDTALPHEETAIGAFHYPGDPDGTPPLIPHPSGNANQQRQQTTQELLRVFRVLGQKNISVGKRLTAIQNPSSNIMAYDLALTSGSSGAPLFRFDGPVNTFCGIHIGGEYYQDGRWPQGWNHGYSVLNPHFVLMYLRYVVPFWSRDTGGIPDAVRLYVRAHHGVIHAHRGWLSDDHADMLLSL